MIPSSKNNPRHRLNRMAHKSRMEADSLCAPGGGALMTGGSSTGNSAGEPSGLGWLWNGGVFGSDGITALHSLWLFPCHVNLHSFIFQGTPLKFFSLSSTPVEDEGWGEEVS